MRQKAKGRLPRNPYTSKIHSTLNLEELPAKYKLRIIGVCFLIPCVCGWTLTQNTRWFTLMDPMLLFGKEDGKQETQMYHCNGAHNKILKALQTL